MSEHRQRATERPPSVPPEECVKIEARVPEVSQPEQMPGGRWRVVVSGIGVFESFDSVGLLLYAHEKAIAAMTLEVVG